LGAVAAVLAATFPRRYVVEAPQVAGPMLAPVLLLVEVLYWCLLPTLIALFRQSRQGLLVNLNFVGIFAIVLGPIGPQSAAEVLLNAGYGPRGAVWGIALAKAPILSLEGVAIATLRAMPKWWFERDPRGLWILIPLHLAWLVTFVVVGLLIARTLRFRG